MVKHWVQRIVKFVILAALFVGVFSFVLMSLWNWLMPALFGWRLISYWQALGILILSKILFGGFRGGPGPSRWDWRRRMMKRWEKMTPDEREKFREGLRGRCDPFSTPESQPKP